MEKKIFKIFFSKEKELKWLNSMGNNGYLLNSINDSNYTFTVSEDTKYFYSIEYLSCSPQSNEAVDYFNKRKPEGIMPLVSSGNWVYFAKPNYDFSSDPEIYRKNSVFYFWKMLYLAFFAVCGAVLCGYQAFAVGYLKRLGYTGNGQIREMLEITDKDTAFEGLFNVLKGIVNFFLSLVNIYISFWTKIFGESDAVAVISIAIPILLIVLYFLSFNIDCYIENKKKYKMLKQRIDAKGDSNDAEQAI